MAETDKRQGNRLAVRAKATADRAIAFWKYCSEGVWSDTRRTWQVNTIKILNLSVRSFLNTDLQTRASSLTYNTLLAIVPALALLFAIGRGFGFQNLMQSQLFNFFPAQREVLSTAFGFVDQYLAQASEGIFVGVGLVFLLWTMISLMSNIEMSFNRVWGINSDRSLGRKIIDYTAILFLLPILMICQSGVSLLMSTTILDNIHIRFITPALKIILDCTPFFLTWISYTGMYLLFPNTKVKFKNALLCGLLGGTAFQVLQFLFLTGQLYVSKYNAIYGSFAFLPLLLIWLQLVWTITLAGAVLCYSSQNIFQFNFRNDVNAISLDYKRKIALVIMTVIVKRFENQEPPLTVAGFAELYHMPARLISALIDEMTGAGLLSVVMSNGDEHAYQPAVDPNIITLGYVLKKLNAHGSSDFIPYFKNEFEEIIELIDDRIENMVSNTSDILLKNLKVNIKGTPK